MRAAQPTQACSSASPHRRHDEDSLAGHHVPDQPDDDHHDDAADAAAGNVAGQVTGSSELACPGAQDRVKDLATDAAADDAGDAVAHGSRLRSLKIAPPRLPPSAPSTSWMMRSVMGTPLLQGR